jgi:NADPH-dependent curcumin reductase CurA
VNEHVNRQWVLAARPEGQVDPSHFDFREDPVPEIGDGEFLARNLYLSLDPAMRTWMTEARSYIPPVGLGEVMRGMCTAQVLESRHPDFAAGDMVVGLFGWHDYAVGRSEWATSKVPAGTPPTWPLSVLGITTLTAYFGLKEIGKPQDGDTVAVSGAAGATGSVAAQLAKLWGCRTIGIAGGAEKCGWLTDELGLDGAIDYKAEDVRTRLRELCPDGVNVFWDNVGGAILEAGLANLAMRARVVLCGAIANYNSSDRPAGPSNYMNLLVKRARMEGFVVFDYMDRAGEAMAELLPMVKDGRLKHREDVREGLEAAPSALIDLYTGDNTGKLLVKIAEAA